MAPSEAPKGIVSWTTCSEETSRPQSAQNETGAHMEHAPWHPHPKTREVSLIWQALLTGGSMTCHADGQVNKSVNILLVPLWIYMLTGCYCGLTSHLLLRLLQYYSLMTTSPPYARYSCPHHLSPVLFMCLRACQCFHIVSCTLGTLCNVSKYMFCITSATPNSTCGAKTTTSSGEITSHIMLKYRD